MTIDDYFSLKDGDLVVRVRKHYQNMDHTLIPIIPEIKTFKKRMIGDVYFHEYIPHHFISNGSIYVSSGGTAASLFCDYFETYDNYIKNNFNPHIILDKSKWGTIEKFLEHKREKDFLNAKKISDEKYEQLKAKL